MLSLGVIARGWLVATPFVLFSAANLLWMMSIGFFFLIAGGGPGHPAVLFLYLLGLAVHAGGIALVVIYRGRRSSFDRDSRRPLGRDVVGHGAFPTSSLPVN